MASLFSSVAPAAETPAIRGFLDTHCVTCHRGADRKGGLDLESLTADLSGPAAFGTWIKVHDRVRAGEMPPRSRKAQPTAPERDAFPLPNLFVSMLQRLGVETDRFASSTGTMRGLEFA